MFTKKQKIKKDTCYNTLPVKVSQKEFNRYIRPHLSKGKRGPKPKVSLFKIFNYILYVLHTGTQWNQLLTYRNEIYWTNVYKWHNRWSKDGSYERLFSSSLLFLKERDLLDLSILHGDGSNVVSKKGGLELDTPDISTRKAKKSLQ